VAGTVNSQVRLEADFQRRPYSANGSCWSRPGIYAASHGPPLCILIKSGRWPSSRSTATTSLAVRTAPSPSRACPGQQRFRGLPCPKL